MELRPFGSLTLQLASDRLFFLGDTPVGKRIIQEIEDVRFEGDRLEARMDGKAGADWLAIDASGIATFDIRMLLKTDDGAHVYLRYEGKADWSEGMGKGPIYVQAWFESGDERYAWINTVAVVGKGVVRDGGVAYDFFEMV